MNVLIYNGPGTSNNSVQGSLSTLTALLSPYYSVRLISAAALKSEPWSSTTSLLVIPGGRDLPYCSDLNGEGTRKIDEYVRRGGRYLGLCAGAYFASKRVEFELGSPIAVAGSRELSFWQGTCRGCAFDGFKYDSEDGAKTVKVTVSNSQGATNLSSEIDLYWNGGGVFVDADKSDKVSILAAYRDEPKVSGGSAAVISITHGKGSAVLSALHPELSPAHLINNLTEKNTAAMLQLSMCDGRNEKESEKPALNPAARTFVPSSSTKTAAQSLYRDRLNFMRSILTTLNLRTNETPAKAPELSTLYLISYSEKDRGRLLDIFRELSENRSPGMQVISGEQDTFCVIPDESHRITLLEAEDSEQMQSYDEQMKYICTSRHPPVFTLFDVSKYFAFLHRLHYSSLPASNKYEEPVFGTSLLYGETVTSSQSLLDKNFSLQKNLPHGFTLLCSHQLSGRGRGQNSWISPPGVLSFSTILHHVPAKNERPGSIIFIQYLLSLAVVDAIRDLRPTLEVRIKWPNDIYLAVPSGTNLSTAMNFEHEGKKYAKISGSLITTSYYQGKYIMTLGIGINVSNPHPTISLNSALPSNEAILMEELFATLMVKISRYYLEFVAAGGSFAPFEERYYSKWLHSNQQVKIEQTDEKGTITGLNLENATLRVVTARGEVELQADGNSFDMMRGLLRVKK